MNSANYENFIAALDIGTSKVVAIVAEAREGQLEIIGLGTHSSKGLKKIFVQCRSTRIRTVMSIDLEKTF